MRALPLILLGLGAACAPRPTSVSEEAPDLQAPVGPPAEPLPNHAEEASEASPENPMTESEPKPDATTPTEELITLGAGCFWCTEAVYEQLDGVLDAVSGYMGGHVENPTYREICGKKTGHIEVTQLRFDPQRITAGEILGWFWRMHDPTSWDRQGADAGPQYRSAIFFHSDAQKAEAERQIAALNSSGEFSGPIVTEVRAAEHFWPAEDYHQDYYRLNSQQGYCQMVIRPKLEKLDLGH